MTTMMPGGDPYVPGVTPDPAAGQRVEYPMAFYPPPPSGEDTVPATGSTVGDPTTPEGGINDLEAIYSWLPSGAFELFISEYLRTGNSSVAWSAVRRDDRYDMWFPGNRLEDGRVRYAEEDYSRITASYDDVLMGVGLNPDLFRHQYGSLISGEVSPLEFENERIMPVYDRIVSATDQIQQYYARMYDIRDLTTQELLAAALDPDVGSAVLARDITLAEIGGEAMESGYEFSVQRVEELAAAGMDRATADSLFTDAARIVPILDTLARRHNDPDDDFDVEEFIAADFFKDPAENRRMRRMISQDRAQFRDQVVTRASATGSLTGLIAE